MTSLPDRARPRLTQPARSLTLRLARKLPAFAWHALHPALREPFAEASRPRALERVYYTAEDGWRAPLLALPCRPGAAGEPVLVAHALGLSGDGYRYGSGATLAGRLRDEGFAVYLLAHRGDALALAPAGVGARDLDFDAIVERDLPAALAAAAAHARYPRVHVVGHGLGGQLALVAGALRCERLATVTALGAPVRFQGPRTEAGRVAMAAALLPERFRLPFRLAASAGLPLVDDRALEQLAPGCSGPRLRGALHYALEDPSVGLLRQVRRWLSEGALTSRSGAVDYVEALAGAEVPLHVVLGGADRVCPPEAGRPAAERWGEPDVTVREVPHLAHLDVLSASASSSVFEPVAAWLHERRRLAWEDGGCCALAG